jgi:hypothetical protein
MTKSGGKTSSLKRIKLLTDGAIVALAVQDPYRMSEASALLEDRKVAERAI